jgi:hypothetical protein
MSLKKLFKKGFEETSWDELDIEKFRYQHKIEEFYVPFLAATTFKKLELEAREKEFEKTQIERELQIDFIKKIDHITLVLEEFLNTNREILKKLDELKRVNSEKMIEFEEEKMIEIQELPDDVIEKIIYDYLNKNKNKEVYPSDIAFAFNLDARKVFDLCQKLKKEGKLV